MSRLNRIISFRPSRIWSYGIALLSIASAWIAAQWLGLGAGAPGALFFGAVVLSAWYGGVGPALFATALSDLGFLFHRSFSFSLPFFMYTSTNLLLAFLSIAQRNAKESLRHSRDDLQRTVEDLQRTNEALQAESRERKQTEEALQAESRERNQTEAALSQAQADLARASRLSSMGELSASLAHEINQPIAAAITDANTCLRWLARDQPDLDEARAAASRGIHDATRAAEIVKRVRLLFVKGAPQPELVDLNKVIQEMMLLLHGEATQFAVLVRTELAADLPPVMGDRVQLQQVLMNLMMNSIDAMKDVNGTRELTVQSQRGEDGQVLLSVTDTGIGLPPQQADQIFDAFFTTKPHGTGMGLRISRSIIESHGGRLWVTGASGRGATFQFTLPAPVAAG